MGTEAAIPFRNQYFVGVAFCHLHLAQFLHKIAWAKQWGDFH